ncbi:hypothetical protein M2317_001130 [Microbacterium sp. ZKA21]|uniref:hypothetical protein n=1 Tax=Microbacterium sp. ZKA21 TaxID=3381694 RepID=UPI003D25DA05
MFFGSATDLGTSLLFIAIGMLVLAALVGVAVWRARRRGSKTLVLDVALTVSGWWVTMSALGVIAIVGKAFSADWMEIGGSVGIPLPAGLPCVDLGDPAGSGTDPALGCGSASMASLTVYNVSAGVRILGSLTELCQLVVSTLPAAMIAVICFQTLRGRPFHRTVVRALTIGAIVLLIAGVSGELMAEISSTLALREVFEPGSEWYPMTFQLSVPLPAVGGALALGALAAVFSRGSRLQAERDQLARETEGLV